MLRICTTVVEGDNTYGCGVVLSIINIEIELSNQIDNEINYLFIICNMYINYYGCIQLLDFLQLFKKLIYIKFVIVLYHR